MDIAQTIPLANTWGIGAGWWIVMAVFMVLCMAAMGARGTSSGWWGWPDWPQRRAETPTEILERHFAEGEFSVEEYCERREVLTNGKRQLIPANGKRQVVPETIREEEP
jgi:uncharacterized membrane protein